ncbi:MAG: HK97-gp10 family putative phage morphogenesis protein [Mesorhizobium sp.]
MAIKAKMLGREAVMRKLNQLVPEAEKELAEAQLDAAVDLADAIRPRAPVDEGDYARSIEGARLADKPGTAVIGASTKDKNATGVFADHKWRWIEFGTGERVQKTTGRRVGRMPAQPHIMPTYRAKIKAIRRKMAGAVNKAVRKVRGK